MKKMINNCVGCTSIGLHCQGPGCQNYREVPEWSCDECGYELPPSELYVYDDRELCHDCLLEQFETVADSDD